MAVGGAGGGGAREGEPTLAPPRTALPFPQSGTRGGRREAEETAAGPTALWGGREATTATGTQQQKAAVLAPSSPFTLSAPPPLPGNGTLPTARIAQGRAGIGRRGGAGARAPKGDWRSGDEKRGGAKRQPFKTPPGGARCSRAGRRERAGRVAGVRAGPLGRARRAPPAANQSSSGREAPRVLPVRPSCCTYPGGGRYPPPREGETECCPFEVKLLPSGILRRINPRPGTR